MLSGERENVLGLHKSRHFADATEVLVGFFARQLLLVSDVFETLRKGTRPCVRRTKQINLAFDLSKDLWDSSQGRCIICIKEALVVSS
jgi:hypothetical protein